MRKTSAVRLCLLCLAAFPLFACTATGPMGQSAATPVSYPPREFAHRVSDSHVDFYYNCSTPSPGMLHLEGLAFNPWESQPVGDLEFELDGVNARGSTVSEATMEVKDYKLFTNQSTPVNLDLQMAGSEVRFDLYYMYQFGEGDHNDFLSKIAWREAKPLTQWPHRSFVRDACSPGLHLSH